MKKILVITAFILTVYDKNLIAQNSYLYETKDYKINFPDKPDNHKQLLKSSLGRLMMIVVAYEPIESLNDSNYVYGTIESKYPDSTIHSEKVEMLESFFRRSIDEVIKGVDGILLSEISSEIGKYPAKTIEINYTKKHAVVKMQLILIKSKMIIVQTITDIEKYPNLIINKFFDSFILKEN